MRGSMRYFTKLFSFIIAMLSLFIFYIIVSDFIFHRDMMLDHYFLKAEGMMLFNSLYGCANTYDITTLFTEVNRCTPLEMVDVTFEPKEGVFYIPVLIYNNTSMAPMGGFIGMTYHTSSAKKISSLITLACQGNDYKGFIYIDEMLKISNEVCSSSECYPLPCTARTTTLNPGYHWVRIYNSYGIVEVVG